MGSDSGRKGCEITVFRPGTPKAVKTRESIFFIILCGIIMVQACYWLFANAVQPMVWGMPFGMFFIVLFIVIEFFVLLLLYLLEARDIQEGGNG
jgi:uncharacterized membrane protein